MPFELDLPKRLKKLGWKVKIREKERLEPPHVTILHRFQEWRVILRDGSLLPPSGRRADIDDEVWKHVVLHWALLQAEWDKKYPSNPIESEDKENGDED